MTSEARVVAYLEAQKKTNSQTLKEDWIVVDNFYQKKLWNEMTGKILELVHHKQMQKESVLMEMYEYFIEAIEMRLNPFGLVTIMEAITRSMSNKTEVLKLLEKLEETVKHCTEAVNYSKVLRGAVLLKDMKDFEGTKAIIDELKDVMEIEGNVTGIHGKYFMLAAEYYRVIGDYNGYYRSGMLFLACALEQYPAEFWPEMAFTLSIAALLGDNVYNVGQLYLNPIMTSLKGTGNAWVISLVEAFHNGDVDGFMNLKPKWSQVVDLQNNEVKLREKVSLLALMELTFKRIGEERHISFADIAKATKSPINNIELLILRAFALDLVHGKIDQVGGLVHMSWVRPRVLNQDQISRMADTITNWSESVTNMINIIHRGADEIVTQDNL